MFNLKSTPNVVIDPLFCIKSVKERKKIHKIYGQPINLVGIVGKHGK